MKRLLLALALLLAPLRGQNFYSSTATGDSQSGNYTGSSDTIYGNNGSPYCSGYPTVAGTPSNATSGAAVGYVSGCYYSIWGQDWQSWISAAARRWYGRFNTSSIGSATITSAKLWFYVYSYSSSGGYVQTYLYAQKLASWPPTLSTSASGMGWASLSGVIASAGWKSITITPSTLNTSTYTDIMLITTENPYWGASNQEYGTTFNIYCGTSANRPYLELTLADSTQLIIVTDSE